MSTTTEILFNSPALHSLKREQLVKLCKIHSIKASGKNTELIERLKQRAQELPREQAQSGDLQIGGLAFPADEAPKLQMPRPSEQWEIVMDDIEEVQESSSLGTISSKGTLRTQGNAGEFGTGNSKSSTVSSSLKAFATSLGIKRAPSANSTVSVNKPNPADSLPDISRGDELTKHAIPYSHLPPSPFLPQTDHFVLSTPDRSALQCGSDADGDVSMSAPVPGSPSRPGAPAPANARLSMGRGMTTTIRLITTSSSHSLEAPPTPQLAPFQTTFDIEMGSPAVDATPGHRMSVWPASPTQDEGRLYPAIPWEDVARPAAQPQIEQGGDIKLPGALSTATEAERATPIKTGVIPTQATPKPVDAPDMFSPMRPAGMEAMKAAKLPLPRSEPFLFGSPLPRHSLSNKEFGQAAASVLEEMHRRLVATGAVKEDGGLINGKTGASAAPNLFGNGFGSSNDSSEKSHQRTGSADRFAKAHEEVFNKMDSIATHYAARRGVGSTSQQAPVSRKRKSDVLGIGPAPGQKRKISAAGARVISTGVRKKMAVPGAFGEEEDDDNDNADDDEEHAGDRRSSKRLRTAIGEDVHNAKRVSIAPSGVKHGDADEVERKQKEREAIRRKLDANKARRRSSRGRVSIGGKALPAKGKASRFGFLTSAKSLVRNVWNMGTGSSAAAGVVTAAPSNIPIAKPSQPAKPATETKPAVSRVAIHKSLAVNGDVSMKSTTSGKRISSAPSVSGSLLKPPESSAVVKTNGTMSSTRSSVSRARSPIPSFAAPTRAATRTSSGTAASTSVSTGTGSQVVRSHSRSDSIAAVSSMGARTSLASGSRTSVSSMGTRRNMVNTPSAGTANSRFTVNSGEDAGENSVGPSMRKRTSSLMAPTASSLAKMQGTARSAGRTSGLPVVNEQPSRTVRNGQLPTSPYSASKTALHAITNSSQSPRPTKIFAHPLTTTTFSSASPSTTPMRNPSLSEAAVALAATPSGIPQLSVPPKPKTLVARKPRISRSRVIAKLGAQRAAGQVSSAIASGPSTRTRSSMGPRKSFGGVKAGKSSAGGEVLKSAVKKRARQSEYARRRSRIAADFKNARQDNDSVDMDVDA